MGNSPILVDWDSWSSCWTLGREAGTVERAIGGGVWWLYCAACKSVSLSQAQLSILFPESVAKGPF